MTHEPIDDKVWPEVSSRGCVLCQGRIPFEVPQHLIDALEGGRLALFVGAGISTENSVVFPYTLYQDVSRELGNKDNGLSFPELMSRFCERPDGRSQLLLKIRDRIKYVSSHPELYRVATSFHRELATMWQVTEVVTTNWDDFFERECGATPFVTDADLAFWSQPGRKVLKVHGSIHNLGEIVVTRQDYAACHSRLSAGLLGSHLKMLLGTRTVVFVGYSLSDPDLKAILDAVTASMQGLRPTYYVVTPEPSGYNSFVGADIRSIQTDGTYFLQVLKEHLLESPCNLPDARFSRLPALNKELVRKHSELCRRRPSARFPETIHCASYQDGLIHSLDRALHLSKTGEYSHRCDLVRKVHAYHDIRRDKVRGRAYHDVAYIDGYVNGLMLLTAREDLTRAIPRYYVFGADDQPLTFASYQRLAGKASRLHRAAYRQAERLLGSVKAGIEFHHTPFLL